MRSVTIIVCVAGLLTASALAHAAPAHHAATAPHAATAFKLASPTIAPGSTLTDAQVANTFGCSGKNISPALTWSGAPAGTRSFAFTLYDPDAPTGSGWWHWVVYDIPATANGLLEGAGTADGARLPSGSKQGHTDFGTPGFGGACPPPAGGTWAQNTPRSVAT